MLIPAQSDLNAFAKRRPPGAKKILCHAPFKSLYFGHRGRGYACNLNKLHLLGTYPHQSVHEIWFGDKMKELREAIKQNDMSLGCQRCFNMLKGHNFANLSIKDYDRFSWSEAGYPTKMDFELDNVCNLECVMCRGEYSSAIRKNRDQKPAIKTSYDSAFIDQLNDFIPHLERSHCLGGEPFLIPLYFELWERMIELNPKVEVSVQTNCTVLNRRVKEVMEKLNFVMAVSLDSIEKENFERIRKNAKYERTMDNLEYFIEYCHRKNTCLSLSYCMMPQNWFEMPDLIEFCNRKGIHVFFNTVTNPIEYSMKYLSASELEKIVTSLDQYKPPRGNALMENNYRCYIDAVNQIRDWYEAAKESEKGAKPVGEVQSLDDLYHKIRTHISKEIGGAQFEQEKLYGQVVEKIDFLVEAADKDGLKDIALPKFYGFDCKEVCQAFPSAESEHLYSLIKEYVIIA